MGRHYLKELDGSRVYACNVCKSHLAYAEDCISRAFRGSKGTAFLFNTVVNVVVSPNKREEHFTTGKHVVSDVFCKACNMQLGWKYVSRKLPVEKDSPFDSLWLLLWLRFRFDFFWPFFRDSVASARSITKVQRRKVHSRQSEHHEARGLENASGKRSSGMQFG